ncbi:MAG TPA: enoyl-CoA hydratase/isomerase family protein [Acidimicrobiales bacterium]|nr:enoyl-CoA hydratase/isomerase family protein [Acidimicrobiales bacterium]HLN41359.1 enoyl-CoA hydratase/isomerase family protein [Acidimicrobiales bacterium]
MVASPPASRDAGVGVVSIDRRPDGVALVTLDRPKMNALSVAFLGRLHDAVAELAADPPGSVVLWGGPRIFAAGADVGEFSEPGAARRITAAFHQVTGALAALPRVTIAAITGYALGGGLELALACDLRVVAGDARLGQPEILLGIVPGGGATQRLPRLVGVSRAKDLVYTGRQVRAEEALRIGLADRVVARDRVLEDALALAAELAAGPLVALAAAKRVIDEGLEQHLEDGLALEVDAFVSCADTQDARTGVTSFLEHGPGRARFVGR